MMNWEECGSKLSLISVSWRTERRQRKHLDTISSLFAETRNQDFVSQSKFVNHYTAEFCIYFISLDMSRIHVDVQNFTGSKAEYSCFFIM
jgi:hypothetical protein